MLFTVYMQDSYHFDMATCHRTS